MAWASDFGNKKKTTTSSTSSFGPSKPSNTWQTPWDYKPGKTTSPSYSSYPSSSTSYSYNYGNSNIVSTPKSSNYSNTNSGGYSNYGYGTTSKPKTTAKPPAKPKTTAKAPAKAPAKTVKGTNRRTAPPATRTRATTADLPTRNNNARSYTGHVGTPVNWPKNLPAPTKPTVKPTFKPVTAPPVIPMGNGNHYANPPQTPRALQWNVNPAVSATVQHYKNPQAQTQIKPYTGQKYTGDAKLQPVAREAMPGIGTTQPAPTVRLPAYVPQPLPAVRATPPAIAAWNPVSRWQDRPFTMPERAETPPSVNAGAAPMAMLPALATAARNAYQQFGAEPIGDMLGRLRSYPGGPVVNAVVNAANLGILDDAARVAQPLINQATPIVEDARERLTRAATVPYPGDGWGPLSGLLAPQAQESEAVDYYRNPTYVTPPPTGNWFGDALLQIGATAQNAGMIPSTPIPMQSPADQMPVNVSDPAELTPFPYMDQPTRPLFSPEMWPQANMSVGNPAQMPPQAYPVAQANAAAPAAAPMMGPPSPTPEQRATMGGLTQGQQGDAARYAAQGQAWAKIVQDAQAAQGAGGAVLPTDAQIAAAQSGGGSYGYGGYSRPGDPNYGNPNIVNGDANDWQYRSGGYSNYGGSGYYPYSNYSSYSNYYPRYSSYRSSYYPRYSSGYSNYYPRYSSYGGGYSGGGYSYGGGGGGSYYGGGGSSGGGTTTTPGTATPGTDQGATPGWGGLPSYYLEAFKTAFKKAADAFYTAELGGSDQAAKDYQSIISLWQSKTNKPMSMDDMRSVMTGFTAYAAQLGRDPNFADLVNYLNMILAQPANPESVSYLKMGEI